MPGVGFLLRRFATGAECTALLRGDSAVTREFLLDRSLSGAVVLSFLTVASTSRVRRDTGAASSWTAETVVAGGGLSAGAFASA